MPNRKYEQENMANKFYMFRNTLIHKWVSEQRRLTRIIPYGTQRMGYQDEGDAVNLRVLDELLSDTSKILYFGYPVPTTRKSTKTVRMYANGDGMSDEEFMTTEGDHKVDIKDNSFGAYLVGYEERGQGGRAMKVFISNNGVEYYLVDLREREFYDYLFSTDVGNKPRVAPDGKLFGNFKFIHNGNDLKLISEMDKRLTQ